MAGQIIQGFFIGGAMRPQPAPRSAAPEARLRHPTGAPPPAFAGPAAPLQARMAAGRPPLAHLGAGHVAQPHGGNGSFEIDPAQLGLARGGGEPLPKPVLAKMEAAFGADFSAVRVHVGPQAARIGAVAFTTGDDLYFAPGRYQPDTVQGQQLLGHELAHVLQQRQGRVRAPGNGMAVVQDRALEFEADRLGQRAAMHHSKISPSPASVQRKSRAASVQLRPAAAPTFRGASPIQRLQDLTPAEWAGVATTLAAEVTDTATGVVTDLGKFSSGPGNHAEDYLIATLATIPVGNYDLLIVINRSPCSAISGAAKGNGQPNCAERLTDLQANGLAGPRTFNIQMVYRHLYGHSNMERALNALGLRQGADAGIAIGHGEGYYDIGVATIVSQLES